MAPRLMGSLAGGFAAFPAYLAMRGAPTAPRGGRGIRLADRARSCCPGFLSRTGRYESGGTRLSVAGRWQAS